MLLNQSTVVSWESSYEGLYKVKTITCQDLEKLVQKCLDLDWDRGSRIQDQDQGWGIGIEDLNPGLGEGKHISKIRISLFSPTWPDYCNCCTTFMCLFFPEYNKQICTFASIIMQMWFCCEVGIEDKVIKQEPDALELGFRHASSIFSLAVNLQFYASE